MLCSFFALDTYKLEDQEAFVSRVWTALEYNLERGWSCEMKGEGNREWPLIFLVNVGLTFES